MSTRNSNYLEKVTGDDEGGVVPMTTHFSFQKSVFKRVRHNGGFN